MIFALVPGVMIAKVLLLGFLILLNLTVSTGAINGLIFMPVSSELISIFSFNWKATLALVYS